MKTLNASDLPIYERAIARFPHLSTTMYAKTFCRQLCRLAAIPTINAAEYWRIAAVAEGGEW